jgi:hypothetical protein
MADRSDRRSQELGNDRVEPAFRSLVERLPAVMMGSHGMPLAAIGRSGRHSIGEALQKQHLNHPVTWT